MSSAYTRYQLCTDALSLAGRGSELRPSANQWLNYFLRKTGLTFRFPELRKIGTPEVLALGSFTSALPADFGAGMNSQGMLFGPNQRPLEELAYEDFAYQQGFPAVPGTSGLATKYMVDRNAGVFRFNLAADVAYSFTPVYYITPPLPAVDVSGDTSNVWLDNDEIAIQGLVLMIYQFTEDAREAAQEAKVQKMIMDWLRQVTKLGGSSRIMPSPSRFKRFPTGGWGGGGWGPGL